MNNKEKTLILFILFGVIAVLTGTYAFYIWNSPEDTNTAISFTTSSDFSCSAKGSNLVSSNNITLIPTNCNNQEHVIKKKIVTNLNNPSEGSTYLSLWLDVNSIGSYLANSDNFKYALTTSEDSCDTGLVYSGNFKDLQAGDKSNLMISQEFATAGSQTYYLWLWLDEAEVEIPPEDLAARSFDLSLNGECSDEGPANAFEITSLSNNYQILKATAVNFRNDVVSYAITTTNSVDSWIDIPNGEQGNLYNLESIVDNTGTYYVWFKDSSGETVNKSLTISTIDTTGPVCTWGNFDANNIKNGENASVTLTCVDPEVGVSNGSVSASDITVANNNVTIKNVTSEEVNNGYKYTITLVGTGTDGSTNLSLKENTIKNKVNRGNSTNSSGVISVSNKDVFDGYTITLSNNTYTYDGTEKKPSVTISKDSKVLKEGTDYTLRYVNNINAGIATVVISGKGSFNGDTSKTFIINKADCVCTINSVPTLKFSDGASGDITYNCTGDGSLTVTSSKTNVVSVGSVESNKATLLPTGIGISKIVVKKLEGNNYNSCAAYKDVSVAGEMYTITYQDEGRGEFSGIHEEEYPETYTSGVGTVLDIPTKKGYSFVGYYKSYNAIDDPVTKLTEESGDLTLYAKWKDDIPYGTALLSTEGGKFTLTLSNFGDEGSGLTNTYGFALTTNGNCSLATYEEQTALSKEYSEGYIKDETYYGCIKLTDNNGSIAYIRSAGVVYTHFDGTNLYFTGDEQIYTVPQTGTYKLEVWGAQGGNATGGTNGGTVSGVIGGYGGYSTGKVSLTKGQVLYINIGGQGNSNCVSPTNQTKVFCSGGYNGGGSGLSSDAYGYVAGGGGATHVATVSGLLSTLSSKTNNILIVAGGGGGASYYNYSSAGNKGMGGAGGGISGVSGYRTTVGTQSSTPGTQSSGYAFGKGNDNSSNTESITTMPGGGGGFYGGNGALKSGGAGGSGYIGNSSLTSKFMYCYNCTTSTATATKTYTTTNVSDTPTADYAKSGDGAVKISFESVNVEALMLNYDNQGGSGCYSKSVVTGDTYGELCTPYKNEYSFSGWYTEASGGAQITSTTNVEATEEQTVYAKWETSTKPVITFSNNGNIKYVNGNISSAITVSKGSNKLDSSSFKYIWSTDKNATPDKNFMTGNIYTLENASGVYYLIAEACDVTGICVKEVSKPFYVDNDTPYGTIALNGGENSVTAILSVIDDYSGIKEYGYLITKNSTCPTTGYTTSVNSSYTFNVFESKKYYVCVRIIDNAGNIKYLSDSIIVNVSIDYQLVSNNYSCANSSKGNSPVFTYTGDCEVVDEGDGNFKIRFLSSGTFTSINAMQVDAFLVGGGGGGGAGCYYYACGSGGGGGYTLTERNIVITKNTEYEFVVGAGGTSGTDGESSTAFGFTAAGGLHGQSSGAEKAGDGGSAGGKAAQYSPSAGASDGGDDPGGSAKGQRNKPGPNGETGTTREFGEETGTLYAGGGGASGYYHPTSGAVVAGGAGGEGGGGTGGKVYESSADKGGNGTANTGGGGGGASSTGGTGGTGIIIIRNARNAVNIETEEITYTELSKSYSCANSSTGTEPYILSYTGNCEVINESGSWKVKFLTSGNLTLNKSLNLDVFLVGGGGGGSGGTWNGNEYNMGAGGGGGLILLKNSIPVANGSSIKVTVGNGGAGCSGRCVASIGELSSFVETTSLSGLISFGVSGGLPGNAYNGGAGGNGGGAGSHGVNSWSSGSVGQSLSDNTYEFGNTSAFKYSLGGCGNCTVTTKVANTGNGGDGNGVGYNANGYNIAGGAGGSGIVIIRDHRE